MGSGYESENNCSYGVLPCARRRIAGGAEERVEMQALRFGELWRGVPSLAHGQARAPRRFQALRVVRLGKLWGGVPPFAHEQTPPRAGRWQVHLVRVEVDRRRLPPQPYREACEVALASHVLVASGLEITTDVHGRRWNAAPTRNCASVSVARLRWSEVQNGAATATMSVAERRTPCAWRGRGMRLSRRSRRARRGSTRSGLATRRWRRSRGGTLSRQ